MASLKNKLSAAVIALIVAVVRVVSIVVVIHIPLHLISIEDYTMATILLN